MGVCMCKVLKHRNFKIKISGILVVLFNLIFLYMKRNAKINIVENKLL